MKLSDTNFKKLIEIGPLIAIDLIIRNTKDEILLGLRQSAPAKDTWFVPGGRIYKNELLSEALERISRAEIGIPLRPEQTKLRGIYEHVYPDNFFLDQTFNTHYVIIALEVQVQDEQTLNLSNQHSSSKFEAVAHLLTATDVHQFTKNYFISTPNNQFMPAQR